MTSYERRQSILDLLRRQPGLRVPELAQALSVSEGTVRNDLNALEADGQVTVSTAAPSYGHKDASSTSPFPPVIRNTPPRRC